MDERAPGHGIRPPGGIRSRRVRPRRVPLRIVGHQGAAAPGAAGRQVLVPLRLLPAPGRLRAQAGIRGARGQRGRPDMGARQGHVYSLGPRAGGRHVGKRLHLPALAHRPRGCLLQLLQRRPRRHRADGAGRLRRLARVDAPRGQPRHPQPAGGLRRAVLLRPEGVPGRRPLHDVLLRRRPGRRPHHVRVLPQPPGLDRAPRAALQGGRPSPGPGRDLRPQNLPHLQPRERHLLHALLRGGPQGARHRTPDEQAPGGRRAGAARGRAAAQGHGEEGAAAPGRRGARAGRRITPRP